MGTLEELLRRVTPTAPVDLAGGALLVVLAVALAAVGVRPAWRVLRLGVTLVHELGHAVVGRAVGRRFTGFVLRGDMSGHAVTVGRPTGPGRVATTWAGYPAPAVVGAALVWLGVRGWAGPVLAVVPLVLASALVRVRSVLTALVVVVVGAATAWLWWAGPADLRAQALVVAGLVLLVGAWRHVGSLLGGRGGSDDAAVLARLTGVPRLAWVTSFGLVCALASWVVAAEGVRALG